jgi:hypothetical protein
MPRLIAAQQLLEITERMRRGDTTAMAHLKQAHIEHGQARDEIVSYGWQRPVGEAE